LTHYADISVLDSSTILGITSDKSRVLKYHHQMDEEEKRIYEEKLRKSQEPSLAGFTLTILWFSGFALIAFLILGALTDGFGSGNQGDMPDRECFNFEKSNGEWANSCDQ
jgi:hypothetical protein